MVGHWLCTCVLLGIVGPPAEQQSAAKTPDPAAPIQRPFHEIHHDLSTLLRREAQTKDVDRWATTVVQLTRLYCEIMRDPRLPTSDTLKGYRVKLRSRLWQTQKKLKAEMKRAAKDPAAAAEAAETRLWASVRRLARLVPPPGSSMAGKSSLSGTQPDPGGRPSGARGGAARADYGPALVELIYRTISPEFWDVHGGPGSIVYYRPWHALVVRATPEIHERIGGVLGGARDKD